MKFFLSLGIIIRLNSSKSLSIIFFFFWVNGKWPFRTELTIKHGYLQLHKPLTNRFIRVNDKQSVFTWQAIIVFCYKFAKLIGSVDMTIRFYTTIAVCYTYIMFCLKVTELECCSQLSWDDLVPALWNKNSNQLNFMQHVTGSKFRTTTEFFCKKGNVTREKLSRRHVPTSWPRNNSLSVGRYL